MARLLLDQNVSPKLAVWLADIFPGSVHVYTIGLDSETDRNIWEYARENGFIIVSKDADYSDLSVFWGFPPKVVWVRRGNCPTRDLADLLRNNQVAIDALERDDANGILTLF
jgi:predicted nuclease of predicted toxin-antitoxin system